MKHVFRACRGSAKDNILFPTELIVDLRAKCITFRKHRIIGYNKRSVKFENVASVSINKNILFTDIIIETKGGGVIVAEGFSIFDANKIASFF
jgi:hypothetical protein